MSEAVIVDIDGTLTITTWRDKRFQPSQHNPRARNPWEWDRVDEDTPRTEMIAFINRLYLAGVIPLVVSGRHEASRKKTYEWLYREGLIACDIILRPDDFKGSSSDFKRITLEDLRQDYQILAAFDDREADVMMYRNAGLLCLRPSECTS